MKSGKTNVNKRSIKTRLLVIPVMVVTLVIIGIGLIATYNTRQSLLNEMGRNGQFILEEFVSRLGDNARSLEVINDAIEEEIRIVAKVVERLQDDLNSESLTQLAEELGIDQLHYYSSGGVTVYTNTPDYLGWRPDAEHPLNSFFRSGENELMEEVRPDVATGNHYKFGAVKLPEGSFVQVGINADSINDLTKQFSYQRLVDELATNEEIAYALFIDPNLEVSAHSIQDRIGLDLSADEGSIAAVVDGVPYTSEYLFGEEKIPVYDLLYPAVIDGERIGAVNIGFTMDFVNSAINKNVLAISISGVVAILLLGVILLSTSTYAIKIINQLRDFMNFMAKGDFSHYVPEDLTSKKDEFGEISRSVDIMQNAIRGIITNVLDKSQTVAAHSEELTATAEQSAIAANEVAQTIEGIATGASEQAKKTEEGFGTAAELGNAVLNNTNHIKDLNNSIERVSRLKDEGTELIRKLVDETDMNNKISKQVKEVINNTSQSAEKITVASEMIKVIADQTNLLALNAAIEAARAGDAGRGFAVVADEIRKLAEESNEFIGQISTIIIDLTNKTLIAVETMEEAGQITKAQGESVKMTNNKFDGIAESIEEMREVINTVNESSNEMDIQKEKIIKIIEHLSAISQENAAGSQQASASVEEQTAAMDEISNSSEELANIAEELNIQVEQFKI